MGAPQAHREALRSTHLSILDTDWDQASVERAIGTARARPFLMHCENPVLAASRGVRAARARFFVPHSTSAIGVRRSLLAVAGSVGPRHPRVRELPTRRWLLEPLRGHIMQ